MTYARPAAINGRAPITIDIAGRFIEDVEGVGVEAIRRLADDTWKRAMAAAAAPPDAGSICLRA